MLNSFPLPHSLSTQSHTLSPPNIPPTHPPTYRQTDTHTYTRTHITERERAPAALGSTQRPLKVVVSMYSTEYTYTHTNTYVYLKSLVTIFTNKCDEIVS